jgi:hypothetical protein
MWCWDRKCNYVECGVHTQKRQQKNGEKTTDDDGGNKGVNKSECSHWCDNL